jgi:excisionase family DNA binding protein
MSHSSDDSEAISVREAAIIIGVSERAVWRRIKEGTLPSFKFGKLVRVSKKALERLMEGTGNGKEQQHRQPE